MTDEPEFPHLSNKEFKIHDGLSKRELFSAMAMIGVLNNAESRIFPMKHQEDKSNAEILAENCVYMADALLAELGKKP